MKVCKNRPKEAEVRKPKVKSMALKKLHNTPTIGIRRYRSNIFLMEIYWGPAGALGRPGIPLRIEERPRQSHAKSLIYIDSVGAP